MLLTVLVTRLLTFRRLDPTRDAALAFASHRDAHIASFGDDAHCRDLAGYLRWMAAKAEEYPDGYVLAQLGGRVVGQLELEIPYGATTGYVNLFYVAPAFRRLGLGRRMHAEYVGPFFRSWEATRIELHVAAANRPAVAFYRSLGYRFAHVEPPGARVRLMARDL